MIMLMNGTTRMNYGIWGKKWEDGDWGRLLAMELCMEIWFGAKWCRFGVTPLGLPRFAKILCKGPDSKYGRLCGIVSLL